jgi:23S rRNA pseudouridine1911/1915/1917 synthase
VTAEEAGERLDRHVARRLDAPRNQVQGWIEAGRVRVDGAPRRPSHALRAGERVECEPPPPAVEDRVAPEPGELAVLHEDPWLAVIDKPAGLVVHPGAGVAAGTLAHRLLHRYPEMAGVGGPGRPGIVHRLDRDTSGVMVAARTAEAYRSLTRAFAARKVDKRYLAVVYGTPPAAGTVDSPIGRHPARRREMAVRRRGGRPAETRFRTLASAEPVSLVELDLRTGRTHQIRVHLKTLGHPLVGDPVYGERRWKGVHGPARRPLEVFPRPALHAWRLAFPHPADGARSAHEAPVPADLARLWREIAGGELPALPGWDSGGWQRAAFDETAPPSREPPGDPARGR